MKKFLIRLLGYASIPLATLLSVSAVTYQRISRDIANSRLPAIYADGRLDSLREIRNKVILIGGSNLLFGIDPYAIESGIGRKVVSLARVRTDGVENMLKLADRIYRPGDVIVFCLEYGGFSKGGSGEYLDYFLDSNPIHLLGIIKAELFQREDSDSNYPEADEQLRRSVYNSFDDNFYLTGLAGTDLNFRALDRYDHSGFGLTYDAKDKELLRAFTRTGKRIVAIHPILCEQSLDEGNRKEIEDGSMDRLPLRYVTRQSDYVFDTTHIFDNAYHLNAAGREIRSRRLIRDLKRYFDSPM
jgi:hypothetical protein